MAASPETTRQPLNAQDIPEIPAVAGAVLRSTNAVNALIHLYRGELGRMTAYRARLDTTTNWAITSSAVITTFTLAEAGRTHAALLLLMALNYFFLHLEARRFSAYEASRRRVRLMECYFYPEVLGDTVNPRWLERLLGGLIHPAYPTVHVFTAMSWRLRRIYLWIYLGILMAWLSKLDATDWLHLGFVARASVGSIPGWFVCLAVAGLYVWLCALASRHGWRHPLADPYATETFQPSP